MLRTSGLRPGLALAAVLAGTSSQAIAQAVWTLPTALGDESFHTYNIRTFAQEVTDGSGGTLTLEVETGSEARSTVGLRDRARAGKLHIAELRLAQFTQEDGYLGAFNVPFLANNYYKSKRLWEVMREKIDARMQRRGLRVLFAVPSEPLGIFSSRPLQRTSDMSGMRIGVNSDSGAQLARMIGARPVRVLPGQAKTHLTGGQLDAMFGSAQRGSRVEIWDHMSYFYDVQAFLPRHVVVVNRRSLDGLPGGARGALMDASARAEDRGWNASRRQTTAAIAALRSNGVQVQRPVTKFKVQLYKLGKRLTVSWTDAGGLDAIRTIEDYYRVE